MKRNNYVIVIALSLLITGTSNSFGQEIPNIAQILINIHREFARGNKTKSLEMFKEIDQLTERLKKENLNTQENFLWERAMGYLDYSFELSNRNQYAVYAKDARNYWWEYIEWYVGLSQIKKDSLNDSNNRIKMAVAHLGNSIIRMQPLFIIQ